VGRRLAIKVLNASRFALGRIADADGTVVTPEPGRITAPLDRAMLTRLVEVVDEASAAFEGYDYARALERTEASSGRSAMTTSSWSKTVPMATPATRARHRPGRPWPWRSRSSCGCWHPSSPS